MLKLSMSFHMGQHLTRITNDLARSLLQPSGAGLQSRVHGNPEPFVALYSSGQRLESSWAPWDETCHSPWFPSHLYLHALRRLKKLLYVAIHTVTIYISEEACTAGSSGDQFQRRQARKQRIRTVLKLPCVPSWIY